MTYIVHLRNATEKDIELILEWRSNKQVYSGLYTQSTENRPLTRDEHVKWWYTHDHWKRFIICTEYIDIRRDPKCGPNLHSIGWLYISQLDYWSPEIGLGIGEPSYWGKGYGKQALLLGIKLLKDNDYKYTHTTILDNNLRSIKMFESCGYVKGPTSRTGESWYFKTFNDNINFASNCITEDNTNPVVPLSKMMSDPLIPDHIYLDPNSQWSEIPEYAKWDGNKFVPCKDPEKNNHKDEAKDNLK